MRREKFAIANIYVPVKRRATLKPETIRPGRGGRCGTVGAPKAGGEESVVCNRCTPGGVSAKLALFSPESPNTDSNVGGFILAENGGTLQIDKSVLVYPERASRP